MYLPSFNVQYWFSASIEFHRKNINQALDLDISIFLFRVI